MRVGERPGPGPAGLLISRDACVRVGVDPMKETRVGQGENLKEVRLIMGEALWKSRRYGLGKSNKPLALRRGEKAAGVSVHVVGSPLDDGAFRLGRGPVYVALPEGLAWVSWLELDCRGWPVL